jgi:PTH1 family peptidyl-tRNA hydrolase
MNESGKSVIKIISNFLNQQGFPMVAFQISNLIVVHDDVDLPLGKLKISKDSGAGGHKGVESIINNLKTQDFIRFRIGIGKQRAISGKKVLRARKIKAEKIVLKKITDEDWKITKQAVAKTSDAIILFSKEGLEKTMNKYN